MSTTSDRYFFLYIDQEERTLSVQQFREKSKDVLVATDVASKGLDFENIQHVINYDMPEDIENYGIHMPFQSINRVYFMYTFYLKPKLMMYFLSQSTE